MGKVVESEMGKDIESEMGREVESERIKKQIVKKERSAWEKEQRKKG